MSKAKKYWLSLMHDLSVTTSIWQPFWQDLEQRYREAHRHYHRLKHIGHFLDTLHLLCAPKKPRPEQIIAAFFHDVIYDPRRHDNEKLSAQLAKKFLSSVGLQDRYGTAVGCLIMATAGHNFDKALARTKNGNGVKVSRIGLAQFLDSDLAILGSKRHAYRTYCGNVAREYSHISPEQFAQGRTAFLQAFLQDHQKRLFQSARGLQMFEASARSNMAWELNNLLHA